MTRKETHLKINRLFFSISLFLLFESSLFSQVSDTMLIEYFNKSVKHIAKDSFDTLGLRQVIFELIDKKVVANYYQDIVSIFGDPVHIHYQKDSSKILVYPLAYTRSKKYGSMLLILKVDKYQNIIKRGGFIYFLETDEDFQYWYNNPPSESKEGELNCPPLFKR